MLKVSVCIHDLIKIGPGKHRARRHLPCVFLVILYLNNLIDLCWSLCRLFYCILSAINQFEIVLRQRKLKVFAQSDAISLFLSIETGSVNVYVDVTKYTHVIYWRAILVSFFELSFFLCVYFYGTTGTSACAIAVLNARPVYKPITLTTSACMHYWQWCN